MRSFIAVIAVGTLVIGSAERPDSRYAVRDEATAIRIGLTECMSVYTNPPRKDLHARFGAGKWHVWWGSLDGRELTFWVDVDAATGAAGICTVGTN